MSRKRPNQPRKKPTRPKHTKPKTSIPAKKPSRVAELLSLDRVLVYFAAFILFVVIYVPGIPPLTVISGVTEYGYGKTMILLVAVSLLSIVWLGASLWKSQQSRALRKRTEPKETNEAAQDPAASRKGTWELRVPWIAIPVGAFLLFSLLSLINALNGRVVIQSLVLVAAFAQLGLILANIVRDKRDVTILLGTVVGGAFLASLYALLQHLGAMPGVPGAEGVNRIISFLGNRNFLGGFLGYLLLPSFILILRLRSVVLRVIALLVIAFNFGTLMLVEQLAPIVGLGLAGIVLLIGLIVFRPVEPIRRNRRWLIALLAILVLTFLIEAPSGPLNSVVGLSADPATEAGETGWAGTVWRQNGGRTRELDWWIGYEMFRSSPLVGVGLGNYKLRFLDAKAAFLATERGSGYMDVLVARAAQAHNEYVQIAAELGILGVLALIAFFVFGSWGICRRLRRSSDEADKLDLLLLTCGLIVFFVHALVSFPGHLPVSSLMIVLLIGLIFSRAYGNAATITLRVGKLATLISLGTVVILGLIVSAFAITDLSANILLNHGTQRLHISGVYAANGMERESERELRTAKDLFERSISLDFAPRQTYFYLGSVLVRLGEAEEALTVYEKCFTRFVDENLFAIYIELALQLNETEKAREAIEFLLATNPTSPMWEQTRYQQASVAIRVADYSGAVRLLEDLIEDAPKYEPAYVGLGNLYGGLGYDALAIETFESALELIDRKLAKVRWKERRLGAIGSAQEFAELAQTEESLLRSKEFIFDQLKDLSP